MKRSTHYLLLALAVLAFSCQNTNTDQHDDTQANTTTHTEVHEEDQHGSMKVTLNEGERWPADATTKEGIAIMQDMVANYHKGELLDISTLHSQLQSAFGNIFAQCSMKGPAHDQLHNYLFPLKERFDHLKSCEGADCDDHIQELEQYLESFSTYFQ